MPFCVYVIYSSSQDQYYVGHSENFEDRLFRHINSGSKSTKKAKDWNLVSMETFQTRSDAMKREMEIKKKKSRRYIECLIQRSL
ncbi:MAG: GIY-YIG nuclease family protein [Bacteroidetes bacterium]|nr:GIY-YIG nuclease family protein [Bacteroidota bacterium]